MRLLPRRSLVPDLGSSLTTPGPTISVCSPPLVPASCSHHPWSLILLWQARLGLLRRLGALVARPHRQVPHDPPRPRRCRLPACVVGRLTPARLGLQRLDRQGTLTLALTLTLTLPLPGPDHAPEGSGAANALHVLAARLAQMLMCSCAHVRAMCGRCGSCARRNCSRTCRATPTRSSPSIGAPTASASVQEARTAI
jgi:hypothetical protein